MLGHQRWILAEVILKLLNDCREIAVLGPPGEWSHHAHWRKEPSVRSDLSSWIGLYKNFRLNFWVRVRDIHDDVNRVLSPLVRVHQFAAECDNW